MTGCQDGKRTRVWGVHLSKTIIILLLINATLGYESEEEIQERFVKWLPSQVTENTFLKSSKDSFNIYALNEVQKGEEIFSVPKEFFLSKYKLLTEYPILSEYKPHFTTLREDMNREVMSMLLVVDKQNKTSFWQPYYDVLPKQYSALPIEWTEDEIAILKPTDVYDGIIKMNKTCRKMYRHSQAYVSKHMPNIEYTWKDFRWAFCTLLSKGWNIPDPNGMDLILIPYTDLLPHHQNQGRSLEISRTHAIVRARITYSPGDKMWINYGFTSHYDTFISFGIVEENLRSMKLKLKLNYTSQLKEYILPNLMSLRQISFELKGDMASTLEYIKYHRLNTLEYLDIEHAITIINGNSRASIHSDFLAVSSVKKDVEERIHRIDKCKNENSHYFANPPSSNFKTAFEVLDAEKDVLLATLKTLRTYWSKLLR